MEALSTVEQSYQKILKAQENSKQQSTTAKSDTSLSVSVSLQITVFDVW